MKRLLAAAFGPLVVLATVVAASAASLGGASSAQLTARSELTPACDSSVTASIAGTVVTFTDVDLACAGSTAVATATSASGATVIGTGTGTAGSPTFALTLSPTAASAGAVALAIDGRVVPVTLTGGPTTTTTVTITSDWGPAFCASVTVTTTSPTPVVWSANIDLTTFPLNGTPTSAYGVSSSFSGGVLHAVGLPYAATVSAGSPVGWGFCAERGAPPAGPVTAAVTISGDWGAGYCANVTVTTTSVTPVTWDVAIDLSTAPVNGTPTSVWSANWSFASSTLHATGLSWNATVSAAGPVSFGYCANR